MPTSYASAVVPADADRVWALVRDFDGLDGWMPAVHRSEIEGSVPADQVGCVRRLSLVDGGVVRERLVSLDDAERSQTYDILESPFAVPRYRATVRVAPLTDDLTDEVAAQSTQGGRSFVEWRTDYDCEAADEAELDQTFARDVFGTGLAGLRRHFGGDAAAEVPA